MKKLLFVMAVMLLGFGLVIPVQADGIIDWDGNGSDALPCQYGGHWVLAPSEGITGAILHVNGSDYTMIQHGNGSWSADSVGSLDSGLSASVSFIGEGSEKNHLQLSHCTEGADPTPTETVTTPTETAIPTETPDPTETSVPSQTPDPTETEVPTVTPIETEVPIFTPTVPVPTSTATIPPPDPTLTATPISTLPIPPPVSTPELLPITGADLSSGPTPFGSAIVTIGGIFLMIAGLALKFKQ